MPLKKHRFPRKAARFARIRKYFWKTRAFEMGLLKQADFDRWRKGIPVWGWGATTRDRGMEAEDVHTPKQSSSLQGLSRTAFIFK